MRLRAKPPRLKAGIEPLESRSMLSAVDPGLWPLPNPGPSNSVLLRFSPTATASEEQSVLSPFRAAVLTTYPDGPELVRLGEGIAPDAALRSLQSNPEVLYAQADSTIHASALPVIPNDPSFGQLWGLNNANNVDIDAPEAWGITTGVSSTIVAVLDSGIDLSNPDFAGKIWTNPGNDAAQGYPNDTHGWNFVNGNNNVQDDDSQGHGTHVSGIIAAAGNNAYGVVGVDWNAQIMPLKFLDSNGNGSTDQAVAGIYFAVSHGARVINASWGGVDNSPALLDAISYANSHNVVFVTAAGNDGTNNDNFASYPASYRLPNELSVAAVDSSGNLPSFSNYGAKTVDIAAPGVDILSDAPANVSANRLESLSGTSMSTAYVSGVAALLAGYEPGLTAAQIVQRIDATAKPISSLAGKTISGGMLDAYGALTAGGIPVGGSPPAGIPNLNPDVSTVEDVQSFILGSDEFYAGHGSTAQGFIVGLYEDLLGRFPDPAGLQQWVRLFQSGTATRFQIARDILTSPEGRLTEVARWYQADLGRNTSLDLLKADPGVAYWANLIDQGYGDDSVQALIMSSPEYIFGHGSSPEGVVRGYYEDLLGRDPSAFEQSAWAGLFYQGYSPFTVLRFFQGTAEEEQTKVARWFISDLGRTSTLGVLKADPGIDGIAADLGNY
jgi:subtilisin family serine protease